MAKSSNEAGPSKTPIDKSASNSKKRKLATTKPAPAKSTNASAGATDQESSKSKAERNKEKYKEWRDRKRKKARTESTQHADATKPLPTPPPPFPSVPAPAVEIDEPTNDMAIEVLFTTMTGKVVTSQNLGVVLTRYLQSYGGNPEKYVAKTEYTLIPPANLSERKWTHDPNHAHQPPPDSLYQCRLSLPSEIKVNDVTSTAPGLRSKMLAKRDAMAVMVKTLMEAGEIDQDLEPKPTGAGAKPVGAKDRKDLAWFERQEKLGKLGKAAENSTTETLNQRWAAFKSGVRDRLPPIPQSADGRSSVLDIVPVSSAEFWQDLPAFNETAELYPTIISVSVEGSTDELRTVCLVTTRPIPEIESVMPVDLSVRKIGQPIVIANGMLESRPALGKISTDRINSAFNYTRAILNSHLVRPVTGSLATCRWLVMPLQRGYDPAKHTTIKRKHIDWDHVESASVAQPTPFAIDELAKMTPDEIADGMFGTADSSRLVTLQPILDSSSQSPGTSKSGAVEGIVALPGRKGGFVNQLSSARDVHPNIRDIQTRQPIPASIYRTTSMLPEIFNHLETTLIARQLSDTIFSASIKTSLAVKSLTPRKTSGDLHHSYERLEFLGDTLLKLVATVDVFARPPDGRHEVEVEKDRHMMLSNRMLQVCADKAGISPYIRNGKFRASSWMPVGWTFEGAEPAQEASQTLGLKVVADVAEALIAAAYLSQSRSLDTVISTIRTLNVPLAAIHQWSDAVLAAKRHIAKEPAEAKSETEGWLGALTKPSLKVFDYKFKNPEKGQLVLKQTHDPESREAGVRFKLLGNALLEYFVIEGIWTRYPDAGPPAMTVMKHSRVGDMNLSGLCAVSPVFEQLTDIPQHLAPAYRKYRKLAVSAKRKADEEIAVATAETGQTAAAQELSDVGKEWWSDIGHTHLVGNVIEGLLGAILEDSEYDVETCRAIYTEHILPHLDKYCVGPHEESQNPKDRLVKIMSMRKCRHFEIRRDDLNAKSGEYESTIVIHAIDAGKGSGPWQELAVRRACMDAMRKVKKDETWLDMVCDCRANQPSKEAERREDEK